MAIAYDSRYRHTAKVTLQIIISSTTMRTIFKQKLDICDCQTVELPQDYKIIHVAMQQGTPCIW